MTVSDAKGLPFATYDLVVYLTTGFITLVAAIFIILPSLGADAAIVTASKQSSFIYSAISFIFFLLASYVLGHFIAFISSYVIERFIHSFLGYPADVYLKLVERGVPDDRSVFTDSISSKKWNIVSILILIINLPAVPGYWLISKIGAFGFYYPKIPFEICQSLKDRVEKLDLGIKCEIGVRWIKVVEHYVSNHCPTSYARLYNYLVIFGLMRSVSLISLSCLWGYILLALFKISPDFQFAGQEWKLQFQPGIIVGILVFCVLTGAHIMNVMAFCKFNRRFFEEAILAFVLADQKA